MTDLNKTDSSTVDYDDSKSRAHNALATISHEVRTPLHAIMGLVDLLDDENVSEPARRHLEKIKIASNALMQTLNTSIDAARIGSQSLFVHSASFNLQSIVENVTRMFALNAEFKGVELALNFDSRLLDKYFIGDAGRITQVLSNLLGNAVKFTDKGVITIWVALKRNRGHAQEIFFSVEDTGVGIPEHMLGRITDKFTQVETVQNGRPMGSGLGLFICDKVIRLLGGNLAISSSSNGSRFSFSLTLANDPSAESSDFSIAEGVLIRLVVSPGASSEVLRQQLIGLGANVDFHTQLTPEMLTHKRTLTFIDYRIARDQKQLWEKLQFRSSENNLILLCAEVDLSEQELVNRCGSWFTPHLPSQLIKFCDNVGAIKGSGSRANRFSSVPDKDVFDRSKIKVLCVDDSLTNLIVLRGSLLKLGFKEVIQAADGQQAVEVVQANPDIDLIFMDYHMPKLNGAQASSKIRELGFQMPIIGLTALSEDELSEAGAAKEFTSVLTKPATSDCLDKEIKKIFRKPDGKCLATGDVE